MLKFTLQWWSKLLACKTKIFKFKANDNINWYNICLGNVSEDFTKQEQSAISLNGTVYDFSVDPRSIKKDTFNIYQYLMIKSNTKNV